jgi:hypothetical protein
VGGSGVLDKRKSPSAAGIRNSGMLNNDNRKLEAFGEM